MTNSSDPKDINALAMEACDMWQEHLSNLANNPSARAELTRFLEPQRRLFAEWTSVMQQGATRGPREDAPTNDSGSTAPAESQAASAPQGGAAHGDDPLRVAQLALRVAELEKRIAKLEAALASQRA